MMKFFAPAHRANDTEPSDLKLSLHFQAGATITDVTTHGHIWVIVIRCALSAAQVPKSAFPSLKT